MRVAGIVKDSIVDGEGIRNVIFLQGCKHHCKGCHNQKTWRLGGGTEMSIKDLFTALNGSSNAITISGGEPMLQVWELIELLVAINRNDVWLYTGYRYEDLPKSIWETLSEYVEVIVDGRFDINKRDTNLLFRGSSNQRLIDLRKTVTSGTIVEWGE